MLLCVGEGRQSLHHVPLRLHWAKTVEEKGSRAQEGGNLLHFLSSADQISTLERYNGCKTYVACLNTRKSRRTIILHLSLQGLCVLPWQQVMQERGFRKMTVERWNTHCWIIPANLVITKTEPPCGTTNTVSDTLTWGLWKLKAWVLIKWIGASTVLKVIW